MNTTAIIPAFFLGFVQATVGIVTEYMVLVYLSTLTYLFDIIMKFAALTFIVSVDNIYANALFENKMKDSAGKKLIISFKRYMKFLSEHEIENIEMQAIVPDGRIQVPDMNFMPGK